MFDYLHGDIAKQVSPTNTGDAGTKFDAFAGCLLNRWSAETK